MEALYIHMHISSIELYTHINLIVGAAECLGISENEWSSANYFNPSICHCCHFLERQYPFPDRPVPQTSTRPAILSATRRAIWHSNIYLLSLRRKPIILMHTCQVLRFVHKDYGFYTYNYKYGHRWANHMVSRIFELSILLALWSFIYFL